MSTPAKPEKPKKERERQDWVIVLLILLLGLCCVAGAGQYALRFAPSWQLDTDMESNIDLNSQFLTSKPQEFFEPLDPAILTQPGWVSGNIFLTPGAGFTTGTPLSTSTASTIIPTAVGTTAVATNTIVVTSTTVPTNTLVWIPLPATATRRPPPADTATNTSPPPPPNANLQISITDNATAYVAGATRTYTIIVSNTVAGSSNVIGASVTDFFPPEISVDSGSCVPAGGATCGAWSGSGDINDTVNLPFGSSITYTVNVTTLGGGNIVNTASVSLPVGYLGPTPVSATDTDELIAPQSVPPNVEILPPGGSPNGNRVELAPGEILTLAVNVVAHGDGNPDLVYYELQNFDPGPFILLDWVRIEVSDGYNWYTIYDWGNGAPDGNTNVAAFSPEDDQFRINIPSVPPLYNNTGIAIDIDSMVPAPGIYPYIRFISSPYGAGTDGGQTDIDAIEIFP